MVNFIFQSPNLWKLPGGNSGNKEIFVIFATEMATWNTVKKVTG